MTPSTASAFVGRERELAELLGGLEGALSGHGRLYLLVGEPGIGKTRIADELSSVASERGARVLWGRCREGGGAPVYWPWVQVVRSLIRRLDPRSVARMMGEGASYIAQAVPHVAARLPEPPSPVSLESEHARFALFDATATFLRNASTESPLLCVFDDLHAADSSSLLLLEFVAAEARDANLLLLGTYRDQNGTSPQVAEALAAIARRGERLPLGGLDPEHVARYVEQVAGAPAPSAVIAKLYEATEGNPLFVGELVRLLLAEGPLDSPKLLESLRVPDTVRQIIRRRMAPLSEETRRVLTTAAVLGRRFELPSLQRASNLSTEEVLGLLGEGVAAGVIEQSALGTYAFTHTLFRESLYEELPSPRRMELHRRVGETLEEVYRHNPGPHLAELAHHFLEAAPAGEPERAVGYAMRAGERADATLAYEEAAITYERALQALDLTERPDQARRCALLLALGQARSRAGDTDEAKRVFLQAADLARSLGAPEQLARAGLGYGGMWIEVGIVDERLVALLEEAIQSLGDRDPALRARLLGRLAMELYYRTEDTRKLREELCREAVETARRLGDDLTLAYTLGARRQSLWGPENPEERLADSTEMLALAERLGEQELAIRGRSWRLHDLLELGRVEEAFRELEVFAYAAKELGQPLYQYVLAMLRAMRAILEGRLDQVEKLGEEVLALGERARRLSAAPAFASQIYMLRREQGRMGELEGALRAMVEQYPTFAAWRAGLVMSLVEQGKEEEARAELDRLAYHRFRDIQRNAMWLTTAGAISEVTNSLGDVGRAEAMFELLSPFAGRNVFLGGATVAVVFYGNVSHHLGLLAATLGRREDAAAYFEEALRMHDRMGARPWSARTRLHYAELLASLGERADAERAATLASEAFAMAEDAGMESVSKRAAALLGDQGQPAPPALEKRGAPREAVFRREGEYWSVNFEGESLRLRDTKGLRYLAVLLARPRSEVASLDLVAAAEGTAAPTTRRDREDGLEASGLGDAGELIDPKARAAYRERLKELQEELEEAEGWGDIERAGRAREEMEFIARELSSALGLGGRGRKAASAAERARLAASRAIKLAIARIAEHSPALGEHLSATVRTGTFCVYQPDPMAPIVWRT